MCTPAARITVIKPSFTHVHDVTVTHGQPDWIGWANATVVELMSLALGLELRRRARTRRPTGFVGTALVFFILISLAAQVVEAESSLIGWLAAALPAIGFLVLVKVVLSRTAATATTTADRDGQADELVDEQPRQLTPADPAGLTDLTDPTELVESTTKTAEMAHEPVEPAAVERYVMDPVPVGTPATSPVEVPAHLLPTARFAVVNHRQTTGQPITADELAARLSISPIVAGQLLATVDPSGEGLARINGTPIGGAR
jgi:hypothetical protein